MTINASHDETLWTAVVNRDKSFDDQFLFGVLTTGVYCRPSCGCRLPLRKNVRFYQDAAAAERAGLRACKRCRPNEARQLLALAEYLRQHAEDPLSLADLAKRSGLSPFHLQRRFKAVIGVTPRQFAEACRVNNLKNHLQVNRSVTDAIYEAGFGSSSRVYEKVDTHLGMTPAQYQTGGKDMAISYATAATALGRMMIGATDRGICFLQFGDSDEELMKRLSAEFPKATLQAMPDKFADQFAHWMSELQQYLAGDARPMNLPVDLRATAFQTKVWRYLQSIPYGSVQSYSQVAHDLGQPKAVRAVARACASNKIALLIPCHRVIRGNGDLAGYKWGIDRKQTLLNYERQTAGV